MWGNTVTGGTLVGLVVQSPHRGNCPFSVRGPPAHRGDGSRLVWANPQHLRDGKARTDRSLWFTLWRGCSNGTVWVGHGDQSAAWLSRLAFWLPLGPKTPGSPLTRIMEAYFGPKFAMDPMSRDNAERFLASPGWLTQAWCDSAGIVTEFCQRPARIGRVNRLEEPDAFFLMSRLWLHPGQEAPVG